jgi:uncharacterized protein YfkK (UPF0435 family)
LKSAEAQEAIIFQTEKLAQELNSLNKSIFNAHRIVNYCTKQTHRV